MDTENQTPIVREPAMRYYEFGLFRLDVIGRRLLKNGESVCLTPKALAVLIVLLKKSGRLVLKDELMRDVWPDTTVSSATLAQNIYSLRKTLGDETRSGAYIQTVAKRGYRFAVSVKAVTDDVAEHVAPRKHTPATQSEIHSGKRDEPFLNERPPGSIRTLKGPLIILFVLSIGMMLLLLLSEGHRSYTHQLTAGLTKTFIHLVK